MKKGWMKTPDQVEKERLEKENEHEKAWDIWEDDTIVAWKPRRMPKAIVAPKRDLPLHAESVNPPEEYLFNQEEKDKWEKSAPEDRQTNFIPTKVDALRKVPLYQNLIKEHFERCLDLYLCPRLLKKKINVSDPNCLIPELPSPEDLKPFPTTVSLDFNFHQTCVRSISVSPCGNFLASGDEAHNVIVWSTRTSKILRKYHTEDKVNDAVSWGPADSPYCLLVVANSDHVHVFAPALYSPETNQATRAMIESSKNTYALDKKANDKKEQFCSWNFTEDYRGEPMISLHLKNVISKVVWHPKGDYFATMAHNVQMTSQVLIHSLSRSTT
jgi:ribosome biogenesis protein ERB1